MNQTTPSGTSLRQPFLLIAALAMAAMAHPAVSAELLNEKWLLCYSPGFSCYLNRTVRFKQGGFLSVNVSPGDYDDSSIELKVDFSNRSNCKVDVDGSFLRGDTAMATLEWGLLSLAPGQEIQGQRRVPGLRDMRASEGLHLSLTAISVHDCK